MLQNDDLEVSVIIKPSSGNLNNSLTKNNSNLE